uniref:MFS domain-containing protein n=1 Tax=Macrostomum lignano TaxID=282301 RepID=A0A1I8HQ19_9PLAT
MVLQIPAGIVATRYPATLVYSLTTLGSSVINILLPLCIRSSAELTIVARVLQGLLEGFSYPACNGILSHWAPPLERSRLSTIVFCGGFFGSFLGLLSSGWLSERFGWPVMFYLYGALGVAWFCVFTACVSEKPSSDRCITDEEREYIEIEIGESFSSKHVISTAPWLKIFTSMPVYAIIVANFVRNWTFYLMITEPTKYFDDVFGYGMSKLEPTPKAETCFNHAAKVASLPLCPHLVMSVVVPVSGVIADELRKRWLSTTAVRKIFNTLGFGVRGLFLLGVGYTSDATTATVCMIIGVGFSGCCMAGYNANHLDIAPRYASCLMGLSNGIGTVGSILVPIVTMQLVKDRSRASWSNVFLITSIINFVGVIFYAMFASGEKHSWAEAPADEEPWEPPTPTATAFKDVGYDNEEVFEALEDDTSRNVADATPADFSKSPLFPTRANFVQQS